MHSIFSAVFPGQGSQYVGMSKHLTDAFPWTKQIYEEASDAIKIDVLKLCQDGPEDKLQLTANAQPTILTTAYAWSQVALKELDFRAGSSAGHSLGEYTALLAANALSVKEAVALVRRRGELMQTAVPEGRGKMAAVLGLSDELVIKLCEMASRGEESTVVAANFNAPAQVVIAGHAAAVDRAAELASGKVPELKARKVIPLKVSAPFHSPLMRPVAETFEHDLKAVNWKSLAAPLAFNVDGVVRREAAIPALLKEQIDHPVLWTTCVKALVAAGTQAFVEFGPGKVLTGLIKRIAPEAKLFSIDSVDELKAFEKGLLEVK